MTDKQLNARLSRALDRLAPADGFDRLTAALPDAPRAAEPASPVQKRTRPLRVLAAAAACLLLAAGILGGVLYAGLQRVETVVDIDVNPGIELKLNRADRVLSADAVNGDGAAVLQGLRLKNAPLSDAVSAIFDAMVRQGYVHGEDNNILVTVQNTDQKRAAQLRGEITADIGDTLARHEVKASIVNQTLTAFDRATQFAEAHGISNGKAAFILALVEQAPALDADRLATYHFSALAAEAERHGVDMSALVDYDATEGVWGQLQLSVEQQAARAEALLGVPLLTLAQAKEQALSGFDAHFRETATFVLTEFAWEGDIPAYHLEFMSYQNAVYCTVISAIDGSNLPTEWEKEHPDNPPPETMVSGGGTATSSRPTGGTTTTAWIDQFIGPDKAKAIALAERQKAGVDVAEITDIAVQERYDGRNSEYTVTFVHGDLRYTYVIHAVSGKLLKLTKSPYTPTGIVTPPTVPAGHLSDHAAMAIAFKQFGVPAEETTFVTLIRTPLDEDGDRIDFRFLHKDTLYVTYIHSVTGRVIQTILAPADLREEDYIITERDAERIAHTHAGVDMDACTERIILIGKTADGIPCIRVSFVVDRQVYLYEISGVDGTILSADSTAPGFNAPPGLTVN